MRFKSTGTVEFAQQVLDRRLNSFSLVSHHRDTTGGQSAFVINSPKPTTNDQSQDHETSALLIEHLPTSEILKVQQLQEFAARSRKRLWTARICLIALGFFVFVFNLISYLRLEHEMQMALRERARIEKLQLAELQPPIHELQRLKQLHSTKLLVLMTIGAMLAVLGTLLHLAPVPLAVSGLILYLSTVAWLLNRNPIGLLNANNVLQFSLGFVLLLSAMYAASDAQYFWRRSNAYSYDPVK